MRWAIALALEGAGRTSPNPMVGAVVVKGDRVVGEGYHRRAGTPHAEVHALAQAGRRARGADLYVTLEPCPHQGRTPPCVDAIASAGISRVFVGCRDPNPVVNGRGIRRLKSAGIRVFEGLLEESCRKINDAYNKFIVTGRPFVTAKAALSLDGKLATAAGDSRWITNESCRRYVHRLRAHADAVMVGGGTVRRDDPRLTVRFEGLKERQPLGVIVDEKLNLSKRAKIFKRARGQTVVLTTGRSPASMRRWIERRGHTAIICPADKRGLVSMKYAMKELGRMGITSLLVEGGGEIFADCFRNGLVDRIVAFTAPKLIGGTGRDFLPGIAFRRIRDAVVLKDVRIQTFGDNVAIEGDVVKA